MRIGNRREDRTEETFEGSSYLEFLKINVTNKTTDPKS